MNRKDNSKFSNEALAFFSNSVKAFVAKNQFLLHEGDICDRFAFVINGSFRMYLVDENRDDSTVRIIAANEWTADEDSFVTGLPSLYNIQAIEAATVIFISRADWELAVKNNIEARDWINIYFQEKYRLAQIKLHMLIYASAEERYRYFLQSYPQLVNSIPKHVIASYLKITPETLSRIQRSTSLNKAPFNI